MICQRYKHGCKWYRRTQYQDPPTIVTPSQLTQTLPRTDTAVTATTLSTQVTLPCAHNPCSTKNIRNRSEKCSNAMCKKDCILHGALDCRHPEHRKAQGQRRKQAPGSSVVLGPTQQPNNPIPSPLPVIQYPSLPPSLLSSSSSSANLSAQPPSSPPSPNPSEPLDLSQVTQSTVQPYPGTPFPKPTAAPRQEAPAFAQIRYYARVLPEDWASQVAAQQAQRASQMATAARFRTETLEGVTLWIAFWMENGEPPQLYERVLHVGSVYCLADDVDLCRHLKLSMPRVFIESYADGRWINRSLHELLSVRAGQWLFFRENGVSNMPTFEELLAHTQDPEYGGTSTYLVDARPQHHQPGEPRPRPRPLNRFGAPKSRPHPQYHWAKAPLRPALPPLPGSAAPPSPESNVPTSQPAAQVSLNTSVTTPTQEHSSQRDLPLPATSSPEATTTVAETNPKQWPADYAIRDIHNGFVKMANVPKGPKRSGLGREYRFEQAFGVPWKHSAYYQTIGTWKSFTSGDASTEKAELWSSLLTSTPELLWGSFVQSRRDGGSLSGSTLHSNSFPLGSQLF
ncbi:hypothetical protein FRC01_002992 [Tulasnella sp. 417]|nr:hypothetical protein FRC01_002992 [Tulasnella sp. 417]